MKLRILCIAAMCMIVSALAAQEVPSGVTTDRVSLERNGKFMVTDITFDLNGVKVTKNRALLLTPRLVNGDDSVELKSIGIYGRRRYYHYKRNYGDEMLSGKNEISYKYKDMPIKVNYEDVVDYEPWMSSAKVMLKEGYYGCCGDLLAEKDELIGGIMMPELVYVKPVAEVKRRSIDGTAYIDFPVNITTINPDYRNNSLELSKINETINSVKKDPDINIIGIWLKGYASPEGSYSHNADLALGRVGALKSYIQNIYNFDSNSITTEFDAEDWAGLRKYVEESSLAHRSEILGLIDTNMDLDEKEARIKATYPTEYQYLLQNCYPALRHTDYRVSYDVRDYNNVEEIARIMKTSPGKLSLNEMYMLAETLEPGSEEFNEVFDFAIRMYPDDEIANLNAANIAIKQNDLTGAQEYLEKAGDSPEAEYARGVCSYLLGDLSDAKEHLSNAEAFGLKQAGRMLEGF